MQAYEAYEAEAAEEAFEEEWIKKYKETEEEYNIFYKSAILEIKIIFIYVDENNEIENINKDVVEAEDIINEAEDNIYEAEDIIIEDTINEIRKGIRNERMQKIIETSKKAYRLSAVYKYNNLCEPEDIISEKKADNNYFTEIQLADGKDIRFEKTIGFFQDLNTVYIIYKKNVKNNITKKRKNKMGIKNKSRKA
jgi:hypothetical protein